MKLADLWTAFEIAFCEKKASVFPVAAADP